MIRNFINISLFLFFTLFLLPDTTSQDVGSQGEFFAAQYNAHMLKIGTQARSRRVGYLVMTASGSDIDVSLKDAENYFIALEANSPYGEKWVFVDKKSSPKTDFVPDYVVVKEFWTREEGNYSPLLEYHICNPLAVNPSDVIMGVVSQEFMHDVNDVIEKDIIYDFKVVVKEEIDVPIKVVYRFRKNGELAIRFLYQKADGEWHEEAKYVYKRTEEMVKADNSNENIRKAMAERAFGPDVLRAAFSMAPASLSAGVSQARDRRYRSSGVPITEAIDPEDLGDTSTEFVIVPVEER